MVQQALAIYEKALGPDHPDVATAVNNLALLYDKQDRTAEAEPLYKRALAIDEKALGPDHPNVVTVLNSGSALPRSGPLRRGRAASAGDLVDEAWSSKTERSVMRADPRAPEYKEADQRTAGEPGFRRYEPRWRHRQSCPLCARFQPCGCGRRVSDCLSDLFRRPLMRLALVAALDHCLAGLAKLAGADRRRGVARGVAYVGQHRRRLQHRSGRSSASTSRSDTQISSRSFSPAPLRHAGSRCAARQACIALANASRLDPAHQ